VNTISGGPEIPSAGWWPYWLGGGSEAGVCCSVLLCVAAGCNVLWWVEVGFSVLQRWP